MSDIVTSIAQAYNRGYAAGVRGDDPRLCHHEKYSHQWQAWHQGNGWGAELYRIIHGAGSKEIPGNENDLYYLRSIMRQMEMVRESLCDESAFSLGGMAFEDNIDWLDCYIDKLERAAEATEQENLKC